MDKGHLKMMETVLLRVIVLELKLMEAFEREGVVTGGVTRNELT
jgi:hypothetical protein